MTVHDISEKARQALAAAEAARTSDELEAIRIRTLGRKGLLQDIMKSLRSIPPEERAAAGREANALKKNLEKIVKQRQAALAQSNTPAGPAFDPTLPGVWRRPGTVHPISAVIEDCVRIFSRLGFTVAEGPDIETRYHNFEALNTPAHHPSLDDLDTFWLGDGTCLRTQTSPVQIRVMESGPPPVRVVTPGRCYRRDTTDATHSANFHQIEGLYVDHGTVSLADLKSLLAHFAREMMGPQTDVRFRPHFFPFTEPSVECDFTCHVCGGRGCRVCKGSGWIEIAGAGMVDPRVFRKVGYDPEAVSGYAWGMGVERIAMVKYGIRDIRTLYENDARFLAQFG